MVRNGVYVAERFDLVIQNNMKNIRYGALVLALIAGGWFLFSGFGVVTYTATVVDEVAALETELADIDAAVAGGLLTPEAAGEAKKRIVARIEAINTAVVESENAELTDAQRVQLMDGLERLKTILITYQATLLSVDTKVAELPESEQEKLNPQGSTGSTNLGALIVEVIVAVEEHAEEVVEDYNILDTTPEEVTPEEFDAVVEDVVEGESHSTEGEVGEGEEVVDGTNGESEDAEEGNVSSPEDAATEEADTSAEDSEEVTATNEADTE